MDVTIANPAVPPARTGKLIVDNHTAQPAISISSAVTIPSARPASISMLPSKCNVQSKCAHRRRPDSGHAGSRRRRARSLSLLVTFNNQQTALYVLIIQPQCCRLIQQHADATRFPRQHYGYPRLLTLAAAIRVLRYPLRRQWVIPVDAWHWRRHGIFLRQRVQITADAITPSGDQLLYVVISPGVVARFAPAAIRMRRHLTGVTL